MTIVDAGGIVRIDSGEDCVVFECAMTDSVNLAAKAGTLQEGSVISSNGIACGAVGGVKFNLGSLGLDISRLPYCGQISVDISVASIATPNSQGGESAGDGSAESAYFLNWNKTDNVSLPYGRFYNQGTGDVVIAQISATDDDITTKEEIHYTLNKNGFITITISWNGSKTSVYANGVHIQTNTGRIDATDIWDYLMVGALLTNANPVNAGTIFKNLVLCDRPVSLAAHPLLNIAGIGDSFLDNMPVASAYGSNIDTDFIGEFAYTLGIKPSFDVTKAVSGSLLSDIAANAIIDQITGGLELKPRIVFVQGGTNDAVVTATEMTDVASGLQQIVTDCLAQEGVEHVVFSTAPGLDIPNGSTYDGDTVRQERIVLVNAETNAMPAWWDENNPSDTGRVHVIDTYAAFGGSSPDPIYFIDANYHPNGTGYKVIADLLFDKTLTLIG